MTDPLIQLRHEFVYASDKRDRWTLLGGGNWHGDCEDFALTALWLICGKSWLRLWWMVITFQAVLWHARTPNGSHVMLWLRGSGWIDNWYPEWSEHCRHTRVWPYVAPFLALTLVLK